MLEQLKKEVYEANMELPKRGLITYTWGNVSGIDRESGLFVIKPSGVEYDKLRPEDMVVVDLQGNKVEGDLNPSSDTATHVELYNRFPNIGGVVHTHSAWATSWAQAGRAIPCYGTTHADYIYGEVPCVRNLTKEEIEEAYEKNTGVLIADYFRKLDYEAVPAVLCKLFNGTMQRGSDPWRSDGSCIFRFQDPLRQSGGRAHRHLRHHPLCGCTDLLRGQCVPCAVGRPCAGGALPDRVPCRAVC